MVGHYLILLPAALENDVFFLEFVYCFAEVEEKGPNRSHRLRPETDGTNQRNHPINRCIACHDWRPLSSPALGKARLPCQKSRSAGEYVEVQNAASCFISAAPVIAASATTTPSVVIGRGWRNAGWPTEKTNRAVQQSSITPIASELTPSARG